MRTHIDLFSGIGGFALACRWAGIQTVAFCEIDPYCQKVLEKNFGAKTVTDLTGNGLEGGGMAQQESSGQPDGDRQVPIIHPDIFTFDGRAYPNPFILTGGFPCQPFSCAGKRRGKEDDRHLWPQMLRVISEARPTWVIGENVAGIVKMELDNCISDLEGLSYSVQAFIIPACAVDAPHRRDRVWIVAHSRSGRCDGQDLCDEQPQRTEVIKSSEVHRRTTTDRAGQDVADSCGTGCETGQGWNFANGQEQPSGGDMESGRQWLPEPPVGRVAHGIPKRVDRLKCLGNAIVPQVAYEIIRSIMEVL